VSGASAHASVLVQQNKGLLACSSIIDTHTHTHTSVLAGWLPSNKAMQALEPTETKQVRPCREGQRERERALCRCHACVHVASEGAYISCTYNTNNRGFTSVRAPGIRLVPGARLVSARLWRLPRPRSPPATCCYRALVTIRYTAATSGRVAARHGLDRRLSPCPRALPTATRHVHPCRCTRETCC
jgi:hypothetical protein